MGGLLDFGVNATDPNLKCGYYQVPVDHQNDTAGYAPLAVKRNRRQGRRAVYQPWCLSFA